jgi:hypothetical protein
MTRQLMPDWMVNPAYAPELTFGRIAINDGALCIECKACGRRTALTKKNCEHIWRGNKRLVNSVRFRCQSRSCGSTDVRLYNAHTADEATMFLAGDRLPEGREVER